VECQWVVVCCSAEMFATNTHPSRFTNRLDADSLGGLSPYVVPPTIPEGLTIAAYRRARPSKLSLRRRVVLWAGAVTSGGAASVRPARRFVRETA
jgi:hypothetical protein